MTLNGYFYDVIRKITGNIDFKSANNIMVML